MNIDAVLSKFQNVKRLANGEYTARCPAHDDRQNSLAIRPTDDRILLFCHASCTYERIIDAAGLTSADLRNGHNSNDNGHEPKRKIVEIYDYQDAGGNLLYQAVRYEPKSFIQRQPGRADWIWNMNGIERVLYRLPELLAADSALSVFVVEGEKDADRLAALGLIATTNVGGAGKWRQEYSASLRGRRVIILPDNDPSGLAHAHKVAGSLRGIADVKIVELPGLPPKGDVSDWLNAGHTKDDLLDLIDKKPATGKAETKTDLPKIQVNARPLRNVSSDALAALLERNTPPNVFVRAGVLTRVLVDENKQPFAEAMSVAAVKGELERSADYFRRRITSTGEVQDTSSPLPQDYVKDIMALPQWVGIPPLAGIVTAPTFAADKTICCEPGYHETTGLFYHQNGLVLGDTSPTEKNVTEAKGLVDELLIDFPFVDDASKAHAVAILLLPFVRPMIAGSTPLHLIDAPTEGTGKGLLADILTIPFAPNGPALMTAAKSEEEWSKRITAILTTAKSHVLIDNIAGKLNSETLAAAITAPFWTDRVLGTNDKMVTLPVKNVWLATANNPSLSAELTSRTVRIRLDAKVERPRHQRTGFKHERLREWAKENRGRLATAAIVLIRNWIDQFALSGSQQMGSFEDYAAVIGGILTTAEIPGFLGNVVEMYDDLDAERDIWVNFCEQWYTTYSDKPVGVSELFPLASAYDPQPGAPTVSGHDLLSEYLGNGNERSRKTELGHLLTQHTDRVYGEYRITQAKERHRAKQYRLEKV